jgi:hypothetical protein
MAFDKIYEDRAQRCLDVYDTGCIVGQSLRAGIDYTPETSLETKQPTQSE